MAHFTKLNNDNVYYWDESVLDWRLHERLN